MKKEFTINYIKHWDGDTCYTQTINITEHNLCFLKNELEKEVFKKKYQKQVLSKDLQESFGEIKNGFVFMNRTQRDFFNKFLGLLTNSRRLKDRNTCFCIVK